MIERFIEKELQNQIIQNDIVSNAGILEPQQNLIIIYGPRRTGKTTIIQNILKSYSKKYKYIDCDSIFERNKIESARENDLKALFLNHNLVVLDNINKLNNIKFLIETITKDFPGIQFLLSSSSSFESIDKEITPFIEKASRYLLYPLSMLEVANNYDINSQTFINNVLMYGLYPEAFESLYNISEESAKAKTSDIFSNYLIRNIIELSSIKKHEIILNILQTLSLKLGEELSVNEIATILSINNHTLNRYLYFLEQNFIIFSIQSYRKKLNKELENKYKFYFYDIGIRNCIIQNFNPPELRSDCDGLWENFCILERLKHNQTLKRNVNICFWKTYDGQKIDYIEEENGILQGYKFSCRTESKAYIPPRVFLENYEDSSVKKIDPSRYLDFLTSNL